MPRSWVDTEYSIYQVQHTPSTASTQDWLFSLHSHDLELTPECSFSFQRTSLHDWLPSASTPWELKGQVTLSHSHGCELTNWWIESQHRACHPSTASKYSSNLNQSRPPTASPNLHNHSLQVHLQTQSVTASKFARTWPPSASTNSLDFGLQVSTIMASKCISKLTQSQLPSVFPNSLNYGLQVHLQPHSITISEWIS